MHGDNSARQGWPGGVVEDRGVQEQGMGKWRGIRMAAQKRMGMEI